MAIEDKDVMLVRFKGTYTAANTSGVRGAKITKPFDVKVKMHRRFLQATGLRGAFDTYYKQALKSRYPDMIDLYRFEMVEATAVDGSKINNIRAMSHEDTIAHIKDKEYPINISLYDSQDLRHQVALYEADKEGQQKLQSNIMHARGGTLAIAEEIASMNDVFEILDPEDDHEAEAVAHQARINNKAGVANPTRELSKVEAKRKASRVEETEMDALFGDKKPVA